MAVSSAAKKVAAKLKLPDDEAVQQNAIKVERERIRNRVISILWSEKEVEDSENSEGWNDALGELLYKIIDNQPGDNPQEGK